MTRQILIPFLLFIAICITPGCSDEKTDEYMLEQDRKALAESLYTHKVLAYKMVKIAVRSSVSKDTISPEYRAFTRKLRNVVNIVLVESEGKIENIPVTEYLTIYSDYLAMAEYIRKTDEDIFPAMIETLNILFADSLSLYPELLQGEVKVQVENIEHGLLSMLTILTSDLGKEVSLYECAETNPDLLPESEIKTLLQFFRSLVFLEKGLHYLSEHEISNNINWLNNNKDVDLYYVTMAFSWNGANNEKAHEGYLAMNYLMRAFDRQLMERDIDRKRAMEDYRAFLDHAAAAGIDNEVTWTVQAFVSIKDEDHEKAIAALTKLQGSSLLSENEKESIAETIAYLKTREKGNSLNTIYDNYFIAKVGTRYLYNVLADVNWKEVAEKQGLKNTDKLFSSVDNLKVFSAEMEKYTSGDKLVETGEELKEQGKGLFDKAKELVK